MPFYDTLDRTPWFPGRFSYQRLFARTAKGLIGGSEQGLTQLRSATDCSGCSAQRERVSGILVAKLCLRSCFLLSRLCPCCRLPREGPCTPQRKPTHLPPGPQNQLPENAPDAAP